VFDSGALGRIVFRYILPSSVVRFGSDLINLIVSTTPRSNRTTIAVLARERLVARYEPMKSMSSVSVSNLRLGCSKMFVIAQVA
jgi:hypothetical protein